MEFRSCRFPIFRFHIVSRHMEDHKHIVELTNEVFWFNPRIWIITMVVITIKSHAVRNYKVFSTTMVVLILSTHIVLIKDLSNFVFACRLIYFVFVRVPSIISHTQHIGFVKFHNWSSLQIR